MNSLKLKRYLWEKVTYCCAEILVYAEPLESSRALNPEHLGYITHIFEDTSDSRFCLWSVHNYKEVTEFTKKLCVCDINVISQEDIITYESLVQEDA